MPASKEGKAALLRSYVEAHNEGVRTHDFSSLASLLHPDAEMHFERQDVGPFIGRDAVLRAFREHGPGAELHALDAKAAEDAVEALYGWVGAAATVSGVLRIGVLDGKIRRIEVRAFMQ